MKKVIIALAVVTLAIGCESRTERDVSSTSTTETTTVTTPAVDTAAVETAARDAAHETGTAMETAGQEIQEETKTDTRD